MLPKRAVGIDLNRRFDAARPNKTTLIRPPCRKPKTQSFMVLAPEVRHFGALILEKIHVFNSLSVSWAVVVMARFSTFCIDLATL